MDDERRSRIHRLIGRGPIEADVRDEVDAHLDMQARDLELEGWDSEAARLEAHRRFGDRAVVERMLVGLGRRRQTRMRRRTMRTDLARELGTDVKHALRLVRRKPAFALAVLGFLALGDGATAAVFSVVDATLLRALPFLAPDRLVRVYDGQDGESLPMSYPEFADLREASDHFEVLAATYSSSMTLIEQGDPFRIQAIRIDGDLQRLSGLPPVAGRMFGPDEARDDAREVVLDERFWRARFGGDSGVVGRMIELDDQLFRVVGIAPSESLLLSGRERVDVWLPMAEQPWMSRGLHFLRVFGRLRPGVSVEQARESVRALAKAANLEAGSDHDATLVPLRDTLVGERKGLLLLLGAAVVSVLLIVIANLSNLFASRWADRRGELSVRSALGAHRGRLVRQIVVEAAVLGLGGGLLALATLRLGRRVVVGVVGDSTLVALQPAVDLRTASFTLAGALVVAVAVGLVAALASVRRAPTGAALGLRGGSLAGRRHRAAVLVVELALSVTLLSAAGLLVRSMARLTQLDPGVDPRGVLTFEVSLPAPRYEADESRVAFMDALDERLRAIPGVRSVGFVSNLPLAGGSTDGGFVIPGRSESDGVEPSALKQVVSSGYLEAMGVPVLRGRGFLPGDRMGSEDVVLVSQALAERYWPGGDPVGQTINFQFGPGEEHRIVGIVGDVRHDALELEPVGTLYRPMEQFPFRGMAVAVRGTGDPAPWTPAALAAVADVDPRLPVFDVRPMVDVVGDSVAPRRTMMSLVSALGILALLLAALGVYAVTARSVGTRTREIGIRMAVGARPATVRSMVLREQGTVIAVGVVAGLAGVWATSRLLRSFLFEVSTLDPLSVAGATLILAAAGILATWAPALRASRVDPARTLRTD